MPFENFYEESDKARRRWLKCFGLAILFGFACWSVYWIGALINEREARSARARADESARNRDALCGSLPEPEGVYFVENAGASNGMTIFRFRSERSLYEITPLYIIWFKRNGWTRDERRGKNYFTNGRQGILILKTGEADYNFEIYCYDNP
jgi:hypothetical protein